MSPSTLGAKHKTASHVSKTRASVFMRQRGKLIQMRAMEQSHNFQVCPDIFREPGTGGG